jgi:hypothetical protein
MTGEKMTVEELKDLLKQKELLVTFTKKDGSQRIMRCSLQEGVIPSIYGKSISGPEHLVTVFDLDKQDWRSINLSGGFSIGG